LNDINEAIKNYDQAITVDSNPKAYIGKWHFFKTFFICKVARYLLFIYFLLELFQNFKIKPKSKPRKVY
jgi:hypothetical protein